MLFIKQKITHQEPKERPTLEQLLDAELKLKFQPSPAKVKPPEVKHKTPRKGQHKKKKSAGYALQLGEAQEEDSDSANDFEGGAPHPGDQGQHVAALPPASSSSAPTPAPLEITPEIEKVNAALFGMLDWLPNSSQGVPVSQHSNNPHPHQHHHAMQSLPPLAESSPALMQEGTAPLPYNQQFQEKITPISPPKPSSKAKALLSKSAAPGINAERLKATSARSLEPLSPRSKTPRSKTPRSKTPRKILEKEDQEVTTTTTEKVSQEDPPPTPTKKEKKPKKEKGHKKGEKKGKKTKGKEESANGLLSSEDPASPRKKDKKKDKKKSKHKDEHEKKAKHKEKDEAHEKKSKHKKKKDGYVLFSPPFFPLSPSFLSTL